jgi:CheY-like chemotaxis protein
MAYILALDDNGGMRDVIRETLETFGHKVVCAENGRAGIKLLTNSDPLPDLIISDMVMSEMDGAAFVSHLRSTRQWATIPVVLMSGYKDDCQMIDWDEHVVFLEKPFRVPELIAIVDRLIPSSQTPTSSVC